MTRIAILGRGKMGQLIAALAPEMRCEVVAHLNAVQTAGGLTRALLGGADVAIDFTAPTAAAALVRGCAEAGVPVVSGTTGWDAERPAVEAQVRASKGALLWAPSFSLGVHLFTKIVEEASRLLSRTGAGFDVQIIETHHARKLDAPSGTARSLARATETAGGRPVPVTSVRTGHVPGTHEVLFDAPFEQVRLVHEARDRRVFAAGALSAAAWIVGRRGVFTLDDFLDDSLGGDPR